MATKRAKKPAGPGKTTADNVVSVPLPAPGSYDPNRPLSGNTLLQNQVRHFQQVEATLPPLDRTSHDQAKILTEGHAAEYIASMTARLHRRGKTAATVRRAGGK